LRPALILCRQKKLTARQFAAIPYARRMRSLGNANNILNQAVPACVFLLGQAGHFPTAGQDRGRSLAFSIMDELLCFQNLSSKNSVRMETANGDRNRNWI
jgi:hypothetical protein